MPYNSFIQTKKPMNVNGYEIKPGAILAGANLAGANLAGANLTGADIRYMIREGAKVEGTILEKKKESPQDNISLSQKVKELEEELKKYKDILKVLLDT